MEIGTGKICGWTGKTQGKQGIWKYDSSGYPEVTIVKCVYVYVSLSDSSLKDDNIIIRNQSFYFHRPCRHH